ncbi:MAG: AIR synthase-related protein [Candidatus Thorarchaeota archaeon]
MEVLPLGKAPWSLLVELVKKQGYRNEGVVQIAEEGVDVAVLNLQTIIKKVNEFYNIQSIPYMVYKADPITFPTPNPARYLITVNKNDLATAGALPYGITATILLPPNSTRKSLIEIQSNLSKTCKEQKITILGGHTEITRGVQNPILSASMIGFVPPEFYIPRDPQPGDSIICSGWIGAEGTGILLAEAGELLSKELETMEYHQGIEIGNNIDISDQVVTCNRRWHESLHLVHDATEGGIYGALYECLAPKGFGSEVKSEKIPVAPITKKLANILGFDPYKLISSGSILFICDCDRAEAITDFLRERNTPAEIIGEVTGRGKPINVDSTQIQPPEADHLIIGLHQIDRLKKNV